jgi:hypothetical protein
MSTTDQIFYIRQILDKKLKHSEILHRLEESLRFSLEASIAQYSHLIWSTHETS